MKKLLFAIALLFPGVAQAKVGDCQPITGYQICEQMTGSKFAGHEITRNYGIFDDNERKVGVTWFFRDDPVVYFDVLGRLVKQFGRPAVGPTRQTWDKPNVQVIMGGGQGEEIEVTILFAS